MVILRIILLLLLACSPAYAQFAGGGGPKPDNIVIQDDGTTVSGGGRTLNFGTGISVSYSGNRYNITGTGGTVTGVTATFPVLSSGGTTPDIYLTDLNISEETIRGVPFTDEISALPLAINMTDSASLDYDHFAGAIITTTGIGTDVDFAMPNPTVYSDSSYQEIYRVSNTDNEADNYVGITFTSEQMFYLHDIYYTSANWRLKSKDKGATIVAYAIADKTYVVVPESGVWIEEAF